MRTNAFQGEIGVNLLMIEPHDEEMELDSNGMQLGARQRAIDMPISIDDLYNLIVCNDCGIGVPLEWVPAHLKDHHGIRTTERQVLAFLEFEGDAMTVAQAEDWIQSVWVGRAIQGIPVMKGYRCNECQYSAAKRKGMTNHFGKDHKGLRASEYSEECKVQLVFNSRLRKYIQVEEDDEMEVDSESDSEWKKAVEMDFAESMANVKVSGMNGHGNLRLMNVFIAKSRWDVMVEGKDLKEVVRIAGAPPSNQNLHQIILCGRRYIHKACEELDKGSVIIKRLLGSGGYLAYEWPC
jgi:hypothetical protein